MVRRRPARRSAARGAGASLVLAGLGWLSSCAGRSIDTPRRNEGATGGDSGRGGVSSAAHGGSAGLGKGASAGKSFGGSAGRGGATAGDGGRAGAFGSGGRAGADGGRGGESAGGAPPGGTSGEGGEGNEGGHAGAPDIFVPLTCEPIGSWSADLLRCDSDFVHRPVAKSCPPPARDSAGTVAVPRDDEDFWNITVNCVTDTDCDDGSYCLRFSDRLAEEVLYTCRPAACQVDADCGAGSICVCDGLYQKSATLMWEVFGRCTLASCATDADCDDGTLCVAPLDDDCGYSATRSGRFQCQSALDECGGDDDCFGWSYCDHSTNRGVCEPCE